MARDATRLTVVVDAENVRRSRWPNVSREELVERARRWADAHDVALVVVFDGPPPVPGEDLVTGEPTADDWIAAQAAALAPYWLVTSDRGLRERVGGGAERVTGGGSFLRELLD